MEEISEALFENLDLRPESRTRLGTPDISLIDEMWIAWSAGFVDGEGAIMIARNYKQHSLIVRASQSIEAPLDRLRLMYGGSVSRTKSGVYQWSICGQAACRALSAMRPYMMVKGTHADLALEFQTRCFRVDIDPTEKAKAKDYYYEEMGKLQVKGPNNGKRPRNRGREN